MKFGRRAFGKMATGCSLILLGGLSVLEVGCASFASILAWINVGLTSFQSVVDLLTGAGAINVIEGSAIDLVIKAVKAGLADVGAAVTAYNDAPAASKTTLLGKISTALQSAMTELAQFWNDVTIPDPKLAATVAGLLGIIVSTLAAFQTEVPPSTMAIKRVSGNKTLAATPQKRSVSQYRKDFNAILAGNGYAKYSI